MMTVTLERNDKKGNSKMPSSRGQIEKNILGDNLLVGILTGRKIEPREYESKADRKQI